MSTRDQSPVVDIYDALRALNASWGVEIGTPSGAGWIAGTDLCEAQTGPLNELLLRIGERTQTTDRRTIAALFALRYGWASAMAIAPYLKFDCVPDVSLDNISLKFKPSTFFEGTAIYEPRGVVIATNPSAHHPAISSVADQHELLRALRSALTTQAMPVVEALYAWSGFAPKGTWGMLTSSWASHFTSLAGDSVDQRGVLAILQEFFAGDDVVSKMQPRLHAVTWLDVTQIYQRRASCCRFYLVPKGELCASCPLVPQDERVARNLTWMKTQLERQAEKRGHA